ASGARFNIPRIVIVPVSSEEYRCSVLTTWKTWLDNSIIPEDIKIAKDEVATCLLGAFIENKIDGVSMWTPTIEVIIRDLKQWEKGKPTLEGRCLIIGMVVGGRTQYQTWVQGMPKPIEDTLTKLVRTFLWSEGVSPRIGLDMLRLPFEQSG
ncbi:hypothetical protein J132_09041, partial [Termitomyces sp. J132]